jgi:protein gp37
MRQPRVFCASLADWLDDEVPLRWLIDLLEVIRDTPWLDWLLLTKRPENFHRRMQAVFEATNEAIDLFVWDWFYHGRAPRNVWIGTTVEDQARANDRIPKLLEIPARVRFLSCEPLLGPVEFSNVTKRSDAVSQLGKKALSGIDWVICGGESGPKARPMHPHWARSMRDQCAAAGVPFFFKQWGEWAPEVSFYGEDEEDDHDSDVEGASVLEPTGYIVPDRGDRFEYQPMPGSWILRRTGKKAAGRLVDGVEHSAFPEPL